MNIKPQAVSNAVNLDFFMLNASKQFLKPYRQQAPNFSVLDLKAQFRAQRYRSETITMLPVFSAVSLQEVGKIVVEND